MGILFVLQCHKLFYTLLVRVLLLKVYSYFQLRHRLPGLFIDSFLQNKKTLAPETGTRVYNTPAVPPTLTLCVHSDALPKGNTRRVITGSTIPLTTTLAKAISGHPHRAIRPCAQCFPSTRWAALCNPPAKSTLPTQWFDFYT